MAGQRSGAHMLGSGVAFIERKSFNIYELLEYLLDESGSRWCKSNLGIIDQNPIYPFAMLR
jgi:hypothetical protein